jgi:hypothetical protein
MWLGYYERDLADLGVTLRATVGRFADYIEPTGMVELDRRFGESTMSTALTVHSPVREGIVRIGVPFGPRRVADPRSLRLRLANHVGIDYFTDNGSPGTDMLRGDFDLRAFRGELTAVYLAGYANQEPRRPHGAPVESWNCGPSHEGVSGLIRIPTADVMPDAAIRVGASFIAQQYGRRASAWHSDLIPTFVSIGLLPGLELGFRLTIFPEGSSFRFPNWDYTTDRSLSAHYQLWAQRGGMPAVAIGAQDIRARNVESQVVGRTEYVVATAQADALRVHLGAGTKRLAGMFGGLEYRISPRVTAMGEYDTDWFNCGVRLAPGPSWRADVTLTDGRAIGGAISYLGVFP